jgi:hypothetical protein
VALSVLIKGINRFTPLREQTKQVLAQFNRSRKKLLIPLHYHLNPMILAVALLHWGLSHCRSTALPECGLVLMAMLVLLGLTLKHKLCSKDILKHVHRIHAHPVPLIIFIVLLITGHLVMD